MSGEQELLYKLSKTLKQVSENAVVGSFSGLGIAIYDEALNHKKYHCDMSAQPCPDGMYLGNNETTEFLLELSDESNPSHDGFNFFDKNLKLTHISQYFGTPIFDRIITDKPYGSRFHTALYGAYLDGVKAVGTVSSKGGYFIFKKLLKENGIDIKVMESDEIKECIKAFEGVREKIELTCESPYIKQIAVLLILAHILKNPFVASQFAPQIAHAKFALGLNNIVA